MAVTPKFDTLKPLPARRHSLDIVTGRRTSRASFSMKRTNEWVLTTDVPSDIVVEAGGMNFSLHKFPLVARSGRIRKLVANLADSENPNLLQLTDVPGGAEAFDLAAKFCYGINFEITTSNVAVLRCAAEYLDMTESYGENNLVARTEAFLSEVVLQSLADSIAVLHNCENLLPLAEDLGIVSRCIESAATKACREQNSNAVGRSEFGGSGRSENFKLSSSSNLSHASKVPMADWWAEDLAVLRIDFYQRVLAAMRMKGLRVESIGGALMHFAQRSLKGLNRKQNGRSDLKPPKIKVHDTSTAMEHEQRILVETIVSLLPPEKNTASCSFLFGLLRTAIILDTTLACRLDLEKRIGMQLEQATLDDLLIPSFSYTGDTLFDNDIVHRIVVNFLQQDDSEDSQVAHPMYDSDGGGSPSQSAMMKVAKLVDSYLAEIAPDANLKLSKFIALAEILPDYARVVDDGLYRAIDIYLKAHPALSEVDRKKICKLMDCQKLSQEACTHAAQNERLPVQVVVQVLYFEQVRMRNALAAGAFVDAVDSGGGHYQHRLGSENLSASHSPKENYSVIRRENRELKLELARMRMRLTDLEKDHALMKQDIHEKPIKSSKSTVGRKLSRLNPFARRDSKDLSSSNGSGKPVHTPDPSSRSGFGRRPRRHSIS
ncbi:BTB/POZ domain-containing protein At5g48800 [Physcomitrium patens]|uniref:Uncharacterized protein n=3 Tax=Physcomitrium patens TaxID=3218 RepID=A0A2K1L2M9_PHYPA|nr:BTB/POZ domain-containing protein At5g48800-like [Physcomitrium patens]PNR60283.1 hypothetical protein PHYPA_003076 [Physcomitrium patens]|eukprot:XP_024359528.1 BTB/POZ domain-containing protein At5g48800-like [Physcomitrella patens]